MSEQALIDRNALVRCKKKMIGVDWAGEYREDVVSVSTIENFPTVDAVEVVHGQWELHANGSATCSVCHRTTLYAWDFDNAFNYCPHCGAKMDGGADNGKWKADD